MQTGARFHLRSSAVIIGKKIENADNGRPSPFVDVMRARENGIEWEQKRNHKNVKQTITGSVSVRDKTNPLASSDAKDSRMAA